MSAWKRCSEEMPEAGRYLVRANGVCIEARRTINGVWFDERLGGSLSSDIVTHWQPLPEPPEDSE